MKLLSSTDLAIAEAIRSGELRIEERAGRFGPFWTIEDRHGLIETALSAEEADQRVGRIADAVR